MFYKKRYRIHGLNLLILLLAALSNVILVSTSVMAAVIEPQTYIVHYSEAPLAEQMQFAANASGSKSDLTAEDVTKIEHHRLILNDLNEQRMEQMSQMLQRDLSATRQYQVASFGVAVKLTAEEAQHLASLDYIKSISPDVKFYPQTDSGPTWVGADSVWQVGQGNLGEGVVIGILDSGVNWDHPAFASIGGDGYVHSNPRGQQLGLCSNPQVMCNNKLIGVYDFTDEGGQLGRDTTGHGSHVSSIAAGNIHNTTISTPSTDFQAQISGVAPHANIIAYKICVADDPSTTDVVDDICFFSDILAGLDQIMLDRPDVVNYSIGSPDARDPWSSPDVVAMLNVRGNGTLIVSSAGNLGPDAVTVGSPANAPWLVSVANISHDRRFSSALVSTSGGATSLPELTGASISGGVGILPIVHARDFGNALCGSGPAELLRSCNAHTGSSNPFPAGTFDGQIVVCDRGTYGRIEKGFNVRAAGAAG